jgi:hypothetical protein
VRAWLLCLGLIPFGCGSSEEAGGSAGKAGNDPDAGESGGSGGSFVDSGGWLDSSFGGAAPDVGPSCADADQNGDETGVDCGGSCPPCAVGSGCNGPEDCLSFLCVGDLCCTMGTYEVTTGLVSGTGDVCCNGTDTRLSVEDCGVGNNHSATETEPNCAHATEGEFNDGNCCAKVTCQAANCAAN